MRRGYGLVPGEFDERRFVEEADVGRVNAVAPGPVDTEQFKKECRENPEQFWLDCQAT